MYDFLYNSELDILNEHGCVFPNRLMIPIDETNDAYLNKMFADVKCTHGKKGCKMVKKKKKSKHVAGKLYWTHFKAIKS